MRLTKKDINKILQEDGYKLFLEDKETKVEVYIKLLDNKYICKCYIGRRTKPQFSVYVEEDQFQILETKVNGIINNIRKRQEEKRKYNEERKQKRDELKKQLKVGTFLRTTFGYSMTLNQFYKVIEVKGNKVKVERLEEKWVSGHPGYTGEVTFEDIGTGEVIDCKITITGLKIKGLNAYIINEGDTFYQNHMD